MLVAKQVADFLTWLRVVIAFTFVWLGANPADITLPIAIWLLIASWTSDTLDGPLARSSRRQYQTWIGEHDLQVDMAISVGLLIYMVMSNIVNAPIGLIYFLIWGLVFWRLGIPRSLGMLVQAPIYAWFIWVSMLAVPSIGVWMLVWIATIVIITWPRFPQEVIPGFLDGFRGVVRKILHREG